MVVGRNAPAGPVGLDVADKVTVPPKLLLGVMVTVYFAVPFCFTVTLPGDALMVKSAFAAFTVCVIAGDVLPVKLVSLP
jgi:hypothetical protein